MSVLNLEFVIHEKNVRELTEDELFLALQLLSNKERIQSKSLTDRLYALETEKMIRLNNANATEASDHIFGGLLKNRSNSRYKNSRSKSKKLKQTQKQKQIQKQRRL
jgi:hypothetical protein